MCLGRGAHCPTADHETQVRSAAADWEGVFGRHQVRGVVGAIPRYGPTHVMLALRLVAQLLDVQKKV